MTTYQECPECEGAGEIPVRRVVIVPNEYRICVRVKTENLINAEVTLAKFKEGLLGLGYDVLTVCALECVTVEIEDCFDKEGDNHG